MKGLTVEYRSTEAIRANYPNGDNWHSHPINDLAGSIRAFLREAYSDSITTHALIVGGSTDWDSAPSANDLDIPVRYACYGHDTWKRSGLGWAQDNNFWRIPADMYFSDFDGDYDLEGDSNNYYGELGGSHPDTNIYYPADPISNLPEVFIGRLILSDQGNVNNHDQIRIWTEKLITYETNPGFGDFDYLGKTVLFDGFISETGSSLWYNHTFDALLSTNYSTFDYIEPTHNPAFPNGDWVIDKMNEGYGLSHFYNHGHKFGTFNTSDTTSAVAVYSIDSYDNYYSPYPDNGFDNLFQDGKYSISYSIACNPGSYDKSQGTPNPINDYWGNYVSMAEAFTTYLEDKGEPAAIYNTSVGPCETVERNFLQSIFNDDIYNIGIALATGKTSYTGHEDVLGITLFGDPEMEVWTDIPEYLDVAVNYSSNTVTVTSNGSPIEDAFVYFATANSSQKEVAQTNANGVLQCSFDFQEICITKHDYIPYIKRYVRGTETWSSQTDLKWDVIIPNGATLNIDGETNLFSFGGKNARIIVENGGTLNINQNAIVKGYKRLYQPDEFSPIQIEIPGNEVIVYGYINLNGATLTADTGYAWDGIKLCSASVMSSLT